MVVIGIDADTWAYIAPSAVKSSFRLLQIFYNHQLFVMKLFMLSIFPRLFFFFFICFVALLLLKTVILFLRMRLGKNVP